MEQVTGIGGLFFRARDPQALGRWYSDHLGVALVPSNYEEPPWRQEAGPTVFTPFPETTDYFGPDATKAWMVNFRVRSLDAMVAQLRAAGVSVEVDPQPYPNWPVCPPLRSRRQSHRAMGPRRPGPLNRRLQVIVTGANPFPYKQQPPRLL